MTQPTVSKHWRKIGPKDQASIPSGSPQYAHSTHSEMGQLWQNPIQRTTRTAHLSVLMTVHSFSTQYKTNSSDNRPSYLQTNIIAQKLSIRGEGVEKNTEFTAQLHCSVSALHYSNVTHVSTKCATLMTCCSSGSCCTLLALRAVTTYWARRSNVVLRSLKSWTPTWSAWSYISSDSNITVESNMISETCRSNEFGSTLWTRLTCRTSATLSVSVSPSYSVAAPCCGKAVQFNCLFFLLHCLLQKDYIMPSRSYSCIPSVISWHHLSIDCCRQHLAMVTTACLSHLATVNMPWQVFL